MTLKAGFVGLGAMGAPMARHLAERGLLTAVANRTRTKADALATELSVDAPHELADLARACDVIALCVSADDDVLGVVEALCPGLNADAIVVDHSTVAPETAQRAAEMLAEVGAFFLDAPVSGGPEGASNGKLSVMVGGDADVFERAEPVLNAYALRLTHQGPTGSGQAAKAVNQVLVAGIAQAVCEGLALGESLGLDPERLIPTLDAGAAGNWFVRNRGETMLQGKFDIGFKLALLLKDLGIVQTIAENAGIDHSIIDKCLHDYGALKTQGHGDEDISALIRLKRPPAGKVA